MLAELDGEPVLLREGRFIVASFHPELTDDTRVHERFLELVREEARSACPHRGPVEGASGEPGGSRAPRRGGLHVRA